MPQYLIYIYSFCQIQIKKCRQTWTYISETSEFFYQQLIKDHKKEQELNTHFKALVQQESRKWKKAYNTKRQPINTKEDNKMLHKLRQKKNTKSKVSVDVIYVSQKIEYMVVIGYFYLMLQYKNVSAYQFLYENLRQCLQKRGLLNEVMWRRINYFWDKIDQIVSGKRRLARVQKTLQDSFKDLPSSLIDILYEIIMQGKQIGSVNQSKYLEQISNFLSIKIQFFMLDQDQNIKLIVFGSQFKITMRFGYFKKQKFYGYVSKMPEKQEAMINNEATLQKFASISQNLNKMYTSNLRQYLTLTNIKPQSKMVRSNSVFSSTSVMPQTFTRNTQSQFTSI